LFDISNALNTA